MTLNMKLMYQVAAALFLMDAAWGLFIERTTSHDYMFSLIAGLLFLVLSELCHLRRILHNHNASSDENESPSQTKQGSVIQR